MPRLRETDFRVLFLFSAEPFIQNFSAILYIVFLDNTVDMYYLLHTSVTVFQHAYFAKV
jgi:hypothetical protein